jgi:hypothetical protein
MRERPAQTQVPATENAIHTVLESSEMSLIKGKKIGLWD